MNNDAYSEIKGGGFILCMTIVAVFLTSCGLSKDISLEEKIRLTYSKNERLDRFYELKDRYPDNNVILWLNRDVDRSWIINFTVWITFSLLPGIPESVAAGGVLAIFYGVAWWLGVALTGGGVLAVLAFLGTRLGVIPGIPPTIAGILFLCTMFLILTNLVSFLF